MLGDLSLGVHTSYELACEMVMCFSPTSMGNTSATLHIIAILLIYWAPRDVGVDRQPLAT